MIRLEIKRCVPDGSDPGRVADAVEGDGYSLRMDIAVALARQGAVEFSTKANGYQARVYPALSSVGRWHLKTSPDAAIANNLGELRARRGPPTSNGLLGRTRVRPAPRPYGG